MEGPCEGNELLGAHPVELVDGVVLQDLPKGLLHEFEIEKVRRVGLVVLGAVEVEVLEDEVILEIEAGLEVAGDLCLEALQLFDSFQGLELVLDNLRVDADEDHPFCKHVRRNEVKALLVHTDLKP